MVVIFFVKDVCSPPFDEFNTHHGRFSTLWQRRLQSSTPRRQPGIRHLRHRQPPSSSSPTFMVVLLASHRQLSSPSPPCLVIKLARYQPTSKLFMSTLWTSSLQDFSVHHHVNFWLSRTCCSTMRWSSQRIVHGLVVNKISARQSTRELLHRL